MRGFADAGLGWRPRPDQVQGAAPNRPSLTGETQLLADLLLAEGGDGLDDAALLSLLLGLVMPGRALGDLPSRALAQFGSVGRLLASNAAELRALPGFGVHSVAACLLFHNASVRLLRAGLRRRRLLDDPAALEAYLATMLSRERIEQFRILFLDADERLVADEAQARGTVNHTPVYPREVVRRAIELDASSIVLVHNHPSGDPEPSRDDLEMTAEIERAASLFGIVVRDHVIVGNGVSLSFRARGLLAH